MERCLPIFDLIPNINEAELTTSPVSFTDLPDGGEERRERIQRIKELFYIWKRNIKRNRNIQ